jgi:threonine/homoserine/homoserine lactone efflux protein
MPELSTVWLFALASLALALVPGPAVLYIVARGVEGGRSAGFASAMGVALGGLVHVAFAAVGLSAILASSASAFAAIKWLGVAYLAWLGLSRIFSGDDGYDASPNIEAARPSRVFAQGVIVNVLNPKTALIFLAFLPQFVNPSLGAAWSQMMVLGFVFVGVAMCTDAAYALVSGAASEWLRRRNESRSFRRGSRYVSGGIYLALGAVAAASGSGKE